MVKPVVVGCPEKSEKKSKVQNIDISPIRAKLFTLILLPVNQTVTSKKHTHTKAHLVEVPGVVVAGHLVDDGRDAVADVGEGPLLVLEERVTLHRIRTVETQPGRPENTEH